VFDENFLSNESVVFFYLEVTHILQPIFRQDLSSMCVNPELEHVLDQNIAIATREIISNGQCTYLNLFGYKMSPKNILYIVLLLPKNTLLKIFELGKCSIDDLGVQFLATTYGSLECLDLYENCISDIGVQYLVNMLRLNRTLSRLK
jgi:hypothetical protein